MGLVDHDHRVIVRFELQHCLSPGLGVEPVVLGQFLKRDHLHRKVLIEQELAPRSVTKNRRGDHQDPAPFFSHRPGDQLPGLERLTQTDVVGKKHPRPVSEMEPGPQHGVPTELW